MKVLVLGGCGIQGKSAVMDLAGTRAVEQVICADANIEGIKAVSDFIDMSKVRTESLDAGDSASLDLFSGRRMSPSTCSPGSFWKQSARQPFAQGSAW
jgi:saccharopine dehydrogenase-like NADP-dependent oxidoreductase